MTPDRKRKRVIIAGDSTLVGRGGRTPLWLAVVAIAVAPGLPQFIPRARGGATAPDIPAQLRGVEPADLIFLCVGVNDSRHRRSLDRNEVDLRRFEASLHVVFERATSLAPQVVVLDQLPVDARRADQLSADKSYSWASQVAYSSLLRKAAADHAAVHVVSFFDEWRAKGADWVASRMRDGLHMNTTGKWAVGWGLIRSCLVAEVGRSVRGSF